MRTYREHLHRIKVLLQSDEGIIEINFAVRTHFRENTVSFFLHYYDALSPQTIKPCLRC